jgi:hypothetical protein
MTDPAPKEVTVTIRYNPEARQMQSAIAFTPGVGPEHFWESLKINIVTMVKMAPYFSDPVYRERITTGAEAMKLLVLGIDAAISQIQKSQEHIKREFDLPPAGQG